MNEFALKSTRVLYDLEDAPAPATVLIRDGHIEALDTRGNLPRDVKVIDVGDAVVMPGIVDTHAHINAPGRTEWEGFETATRAAAAGGTTTVIDMPLNSIPPTTTRAAFDAKSEAAHGRCAIDYGFWGGVIPGNARELQVLIDVGVFGFKAFMIESGVDEFPMSRESDLRAAMPILEKAGVPLLVHAELCAEGESASRASRSYRSYLDSRPQRWEVDAIKMMIRLVRETGCRVHIVHLSAAEALADLRAARAEGLPITAETCPHYLSFFSEEIPDGATHYKCAPPIREKENRERLWAALVDGTVDFIVSDHSPCTPSLKHLESGDFERAWGGIAGLQFSMSVVWTEMRRRGLSIQQLSRWMSANTAHFAGLGQRKGRLAAGYDADLVVWNPDRSYALSEAMVKHRHRLTPYAGCTLYGAVEKTYVRGQCVYDNGKYLDKPTGTRLLRGKAGDKL